MAQAEQLTDPITHHGEGPVWDPVAGMLRCVDMYTGDIVTVGETVSRTHAGEIAAAWRPRAGGGMVVAVTDGFALLDEAGAVETVVPAFDDTAVRMNDGACDPQGRFYCGTMGWQAEPGAGSLFRLDPDRTVTRVLNDVTISNGLAWVPDGSFAYYIDTATQRVDRLTFDEAGEVVDRGPVIEIPAEHGGPDGMTVDVDGDLWVAMWGGSAVRHYSPDGELREVIEVAAQQVSACTFGGPDLSTLFITTSREDVDDDPLAGAIFSYATGSTGIPVQAYAG